MSEASTDLLNQVDQHLNHPNQAWLLGAGISKDAGLPLMMDLTAQVFKKSEGKAHAAVLSAMKAELPADAHIEHMLSQLGDYMAIAKRVPKRAFTAEFMGLYSKKKTVNTNGGVFRESLDFLKTAEWEIFNVKFRGSQRPSYRSHSRSLGDVNSS